jgi:hypothetical protein
MRMEGTSTQRRVQFPVAVGGAEANALAVMSQGELHALVLAVGDHVASRASVSPCPGCRSASLRMTRPGR